MEPSIILSYTERTCTALGAFLYPAYKTHVAVSSASTNQTQIWVYFWAFRACSFSLFGYSVAERVFLAVLPLAIQVYIWKNAPIPILKQNNNHYYIRACELQLWIDFPFMSSEGISCYVRQYESYSVCHRMICNKVMGRRDVPFPSSNRNNVLMLLTQRDSDYSYTSRLSRALRGETLTQDQHDRLAFRGYLTTLYDPVQRTDMERRSTVSNYLLARAGSFNVELRTCREALKKWMDAVDARQRRAECQCCYEVRKVDEMIPCRERNHLFCSSCLTTYLQDRVYGAASFGNDKDGTPNMELKCIHGSGCSSGFASRSLEAIMDEKLCSVYDELQFLISVRSANVEDLVKCPRCSYMAVAPKVEESKDSNRTFACPLCGHVGCCNCEEDSHPGRACQVATGTRTALEEVKAGIAIRECPNRLCRKPIVKSDGCNKIRCSSCGTNLCYVCRQKIRTYHHFCRTPHCNHSSCGKCALNCNTEEEDDRAMRRAEREVAICESDRTTPWRTNDNMTELHIITVCPNPFCRRSVFKSSDANRVQCRCGLCFCGVCRRRIGGWRRTGAKHFCNTLECTHVHCGKCPAYSTKEEHKGREE